MNIEDLRAFCSQLEEAEECFPFGPDILVYKVRGKIFLLARLNTSPLQFNIKCEPEKAIALREVHAEVLPGYHMNKKHWNTIYVNGRIPRKLLQEWIVESYQLVYG